MKVIIKQLYIFHGFQWLLVVVTGLKLIAMGFFSSDYQYKMFMPFVETFLSNSARGYFNPYEYYYNQHLTPLFPYPPFMLYIESLGGMVLHLWQNCPLFLQNLFFKLPSLFFDFFGLYYLLRLYPQRRMYIGVLYFASPIIFYATYMHGQLDIIPTSLLMGSLYYLLCKGQNYKLYFAILLAAALLTKLHILALVPILFIYLLKKEGIACSSALIGGALILTLFMMAPFISTGFFESVLFNNEQRLLTQVYLSFVDLKLYLPILAVIFIYLQEFMLANINKDLLISFCGLLFVVFLALLPPMPGWYIWIVPFLIMFFINAQANRRNNLYGYLALNFFYLLYFLCFHHTDKIDLYFMTIDISSNIYVASDVIRNVVFTMLTGLLIYNALFMYQLGVASNVFYKRKGMPFTIGIAGDSGTGKSMLIQFLAKSLGTKNVLIIEGDGDHKWERGQDMWNVYTHLNPKANYLYRQAIDIQQLRKGISVNRIEYDHSTGNFTDGHKVRPNRYILLGGLHSFYLPQMRQTLDFKIYMDTAEGLRRYWKIQRDTAKRDYNKKRIIEQIEGRMEDAKKYIIPQKNYADLVIQYFDKNLADCCIENHQVVISMKITMSSELNLEALVHLLTEYEVAIAYEYTEDLKKQIVIFDGTSLLGKNIPFKDIAHQIIPQFDELTCEDFYCNDNISGIVQLMIFIGISHKMQGDSK